MSTMRMTSTAASRRGPARHRDVRRRPAVRPRRQGPARGPLPRPRAVLAALQRAGARARRGRRAAAAGAGAVPGDLRLQPRRVLHGPGRRPEAPDRRRRRRAAPRPACCRARCSSRSWSTTARADGRGTRRCSATRSCPRWPSRASSCCAGPTSTDEEQKDCKRLFKERVFPVLTPLAVDPAHPFPYISGLSLNLAVLVRNPETGKEHFARVKVPPIFRGSCRSGDAAVRAAGGRDRRAPQAGCSPAWR